MANLQLSEIRAEQVAMQADSGATTVTRDALATQYHSRNVEAVGTVEDVSGPADELTVFLATGGETLTCPLVRVRGRTMESALAEVRSWRKGDQVRVEGKLLWKTFDAEMQIDVVAAAKEPAAA